MPNCYYRFLCIYLLLMLPRALYAQQEFVVQGVVFKKGTSERVAKAVIINYRSHSPVVTDNLGTFQLKVSLGDTVSVAKEGFGSEVVVISSRLPLVIEIKQGIELQEVTITGETKKQELESVRGDYRKNGSFYAGKPPVLSFINSPLTFVYELFGRTPGRAKRFNRFANNELEQTEVDRRFTKSLVQNLTKLGDEELLNFMQASRPSFEQISAWSDYDLINYVKKSFENYKKGNLPPPLPKLY